MAAPNPKTPGFPQEQVAAVTLASLGILSQFLPLSEEAKQGVVQVVTIVAPTVAVSGAAVRVGRQKWWQNFMTFDHDADPSTPEMKVPMPFLVALCGIALVALGLGIALLVIVL